MKVISAIFLFATLVAVVSADVGRRAQFNAWKEQYGKNYASVHEQEYRFRVWSKTLEYVEAHNAKDSSFTVGMNKFADLTPEEYRKTYLGTPITVDPSTVHVDESVIAPEDNQVDWRTKGAVTYVKNQGQCGSCWSFSTTGCVEGANAIAGNTLTPLSEQQMVDCDTTDAGCDGGLMRNAFQYIMSTGGLETETNYPYTAQDGTCEFEKSKIAQTMTGFTPVQSGSESDLANKCAADGPISIAIDASHMSFQTYTSGVYDEPNCSSTQLDHGVLAVGYGTDSSSGKDYWIVKNSWGTDWGMKGYIWMSRNANNQCGVATYASACAASSSI
jgi:cathepsin L